MHHTTVEKNANNNNSSNNSNNTINSNSSNSNNNNNNINTQSVQHTAYILTIQVRGYIKHSWQSCSARWLQADKQGFSNAAQSPTQYGSRFDSMSIWSLHWPHPSCREAKAYISPWCFGFAEEFTERSKATSHTLSACCVDHELLRKLDDQLRAAVCSICNVSLTDDQWLQASLAVHNGGLGLRRMSSLASSAFLASAAGTRQLQDQILHRVSQEDDETFDNLFADSC